MDRPGTCLILDKKYNIANSSCHFGSYGSIWTGPTPKKYYMDLRSFGPYNIFLVTDRSIYFHMTLSAMNYLLSNHWMQKRMQHILVLYETCHNWTSLGTKKSLKNTKGVIRICTSKQDRQHNGQKKRDKKTNNDLQNIHIKLKIE
jgi:hypothetical protein